MPARSWLGKENKRQHVRQALCCPPVGAIDDGGRIVIRISPYAEVSTRGGRPGRGGSSAAAARTSRGVLTPCSHAPSPGKVTGRALPLRITLAPVTSIRAQEARSERVARAFDLPLLVGALLVVPLIVLEQSHVGEPWRAGAVILDWAVWLLFLAELVVMTTIVGHRGRWLREHPLEVAIVVLTPPFLTAGLQVARVFRLLRLLRLMRLAQVGRRALSLEGLRLTAVIALVTVFAGGAMFAELEHRSTWDGIYWSIMTMTTFGSNIPITTTGGRVLSIVAVLVGIGFVALLTGAIARRFLSGEVEAVADEVALSEDDVLNQVREIAERLRKLENAVSHRERERVSDTTRRGLPASEEKTWPT